MLFLTVTLIDRFYFKGTAESHSFNSIVLKRNVRKNRDANLPSKDLNP